MERRLKLTSSITRYFIVKVCAEMVFSELSVSSTGTERESVKVPT